MTITVLVNDAHVPAGHLARVARKRRIPLDYVRLSAGDVLPDPAGVEAVVVLGGEMGAYDTDVYPYLLPERQFLEAVVALGTPTLGICLGCQLLADALGGSAYLADAPEYHLGPIEVLETDVVAEQLASGPAFALHRDTWALPPGATLVARTTGFNHAFRFGSALGVQSHPELTEETLSVWLATPEGVELATAAGTDGATVLREFSDAANETRRVATRFFGAWFDEVGA